MRLSLLILSCVLASAWNVPAFAQGKIDIFACEPQWAALAKELTGDAAVITTAAGTREDPAKVQVTDKLVSAIRRAKLVFCSGGGMESTWLPALLAKTPNPSVQAGSSGNLMAIDFVIPLDLPATAPDAVGSANSPADAETGANPNVHLNPHNIMLVAEEFQKRLSEIDPDNRSLYEKQYNKFFERWQDAMDRWEQSTAGLFGLTVATDDDFLAYLVDWLGLTNVGTVEEDGAPPSKAHMKDLIETLKKRPVRVILCTPFDTSGAAKQLAAATGTKILVLPYTVGGDNESGDLFALFDRTLGLLETLNS